MKKRMTADIMQDNHTEASADVALQSPHRLSGFNSTIIHTIDTDVTRTRRALCGLLTSSQKIWLQDPGRRRNSNICQTVFHAQYVQGKKDFCRSFIKIEIYRNRNIESPYFDLDSAKVGETEDLYL